MPVVTYDLWKLASPPEPKIVGYCECGEPVFDNLGNHDFTCEGECGYEIVY